MSPMSLQSRAFDNPQGVNPNRGLNKYFVPDGAAG